MPFQIKVASIQQKVQHLLVFTAMCIFIGLVIYVTGGFQDESDPNQQINPIETYGWCLTILFYVLRALPCLSLPFTLSNFLGLTFFNTFPSKPHLKSSPLLGPFICFRVVTRGDYPLLVRENVEQNLSTCIKVGLDNFMIEVVTDKPIHLQDMPRLRTLVVPYSYSTRAGSLYKARALQYCLESDINILSDEDWIVHLDEETVLTEDSVIGIFNFVADGNVEFGQGVITYAKDKIVNWCTTLSDCVRVGIDFGSLQFTFRTFKKPIFSWKGSFVVANVGAEKKVSFDHGPEASIAEDCYFAMVAFREGYKFGFVEGEMYEKSTFTVIDFVRQRKRWMQGIYATVCSSSIPFKYKIGICCMVISWICMPLTTLNVPLTLFFPVPLLPHFNFICGFIAGMMGFLSIFGAAKSFSWQKLGTARYISVCLAACINIPIMLLLENAATIWWILSKKQISFHVVNKDSRNPHIILT
ncbi:EGH [Acanthosepion pharaonis]|uniref:EGH n=1 Tax=Acanthosepion pharaonis TaxID=158019 RepID=A0A812BQ16_ACAPH|nr:EGH [Sepia pharaonis]